MGRAHAGTAVAFLAIDRDFSAWRATTHGQRATGRRANCQLRERVESPRRAFVFGSVAVGDFAGLGRTRAVSAKTRANHFATLAPIGGDRLVASGAVGRPGFSEQTTRRLSLSSGIKSPAVSIAGRVITGKFVGAGYARPLVAAREPLAAAGVVSHLRGTERRSSWAGWT